MKMSTWSFVVLEHGRDEPDVACKIVFMEMPTDTTAADAELAAKDLAQEQFGPVAVVQDVCLDS
jgi:hypothetical protein